LNSKAIIRFVWWTARRGVGVAKPVTKLISATPEATRRI